MTNIDLALKLRHAAWWPSAVLGKIASAHTDGHENMIIEMNLDRIAWAAAVALWKAGWIADLDDEAVVWCRIYPKIATASDPDPLRATLLAAVEMEGAK
jgi:hypothetical protein